MVVAFPNTYNQLVTQLVNQVTVERPNDQDLPGKLTAALELLRCEAAKNPFTAASAAASSSDASRPLPPVDPTYARRRAGAKALQQRREFRNKFDKFLIEIIGILRIK